MSRRVVDCAAASGFTRVHTYLFTEGAIDAAAGPAERALLSPPVEAAQRTGGRADEVFSALDAMASARTGMASAPRSHP